MLWGVLLELVSLGGGTLKAERVSTGDMCEKEKNHQSKTKKRSVHVYIWSLHKTTPSFPRNEHSEPAQTFVWWIMSIVYFVPISSRLWALLKSLPRGPLLGSCSHYNWEGSVVPQLISQHIWTKWAFRILNHRLITLSPGALLDLQLPCKCTCGAVITGQHWHTQSSNMMFSGVSRLTFQCHWASFGQILFVHW